MKYLSLADLGIAESQVHVVESREELDASVAAILKAKRVALV